MGFTQNILILPITIIKVSESSYECHSVKSFPFMSLQNVCTKTKQWFYVCVCLYEIFHSYYHDEHVVGDGDDDDDPLKYLDDDANDDTNIFGI